MGGGAAGVREIVKACKCSSWHLNKKKNCFVWRPSRNEGLYTCCCRVAVKSLPIAFVELCSNQVYRSRHPAAVFKSLAPFAKRSQVYVLAMSITRACECRVRVETTAVFAACMFEYYVASSFWCSQVPSSNPTPGAPYIVACTTPTCRENLSVTCVRHYEQLHLVCLRNELNTFVQNALLLIGVVVFDF